MIEIKLKQCPFCGGEPKIARVGDYREYFVYICPKCAKTPVHNSQARQSEIGAGLIWNKMVRRVEESNG